MKLDNRLIVEWEYASEERLRTRNALYRNLIEGENAEDVALRAVAEAAPRRVVDVGCGTGEFAGRVARELRAEVAAVDISPRMVDLTRARGIVAEVADVQALPFGDGEFDCAVANWVLYHAADVDKAIAELARVLRPGGRLVAATVADRNLPELWDLLGDSSATQLSFGREGGAEQLGRHFAAVERRDTNGTVVIPDAETMRTLVAATISRAHLSDRVPELDGPFRASCFHTIFVARRAP